MPRILGIRRINADEGLNFGIAKVDRYRSALACEVVNEVGKVGIGRSTAIRFIPKKIERASRIEGNSIVYLQIVDVAAEFEGMASQGVAQGFLELVGLVTAKLRKPCRNTQRRQTRGTVKTDAWRIRQWTRCGGRGWPEREINIRIREPEFVYGPRRKRMVPASGECLRRSPLLGVKRRQCSRVIEKVRRQGSVRTPITCVQRIGSRSVPIQTRTPLSGEALFGDARSLKRVLFHRTAVHPCGRIRSKRNGKKIGPCRGRHQASQRGE